MWIDSSKNYLLVAVLFVVFLHAFSFGPAMGMEIDKNGQMSPCPFTQAVSICTMNLSQHLSSWQNMLTATVNNSPSILALIGLIVLAVALISRTSVIDQNKESTSYEFYTHEHRKKTNFDKLLELFSRGILNPKIYALASL